MPTRVTYVVSDISKALAFEWITIAFNRSIIEVSYILLGESGTPLSSFLKSQQVPFFEIPFAGKKSLPAAWWKTFRVLQRSKPDVVHTHLYFANLVGLTAAWTLGIRRRIHTRHHGSLHHQYFPRAVFLDKFLNKLSTRIIVLCQNQKKIVRDWEGVPESKVCLIPHGFDLDYFQKVEASQVDALRLKYGLSNEARPVVGVISRYTEWKGIQYIIPAFRELLQAYPNAKLILANAHGDYADQIQKLLKDLPPASFIQIRFEAEIAALYRLFDIFVHVPVDEYSEAFGQTYVEALAAGVPSIFTLSGIAGDFIQHKTNAMVVRYRDSNEIFRAIIQVLDNESLRASLIHHGKESVRERFAIQQAVTKLTALYES